MPLVQGARLVPTEPNSYLATSEGHGSYRDANLAYPAQAAKLNGYFSQNAGYGEQRATEQLHAPPRHDEQLLWAMQGAMQGGMQAFGNQNAHGSDRTYGAQPLGGGTGGAWVHGRALSVTHRGGPAKGDRGV